MTATPEPAVPARVDSPVRRPAPSSAVGRWLLEHRVQPVVGPESDGQHAKPHTWRLRAHSEGWADDDPVATSGHDLERGLRTILDGLQAQLPTRP